MTEEQVKEMMRQAGLERSFGWVCAYLATVATARMNFVTPGGIEAAKRFVQFVIDGLKNEVVRNTNPGKKYIQEKILSSLLRIGDGETSSIKKLDQIIAFPDVPILTENTPASLRLEFLQTQNADELSRLSLFRNPTKANRGEALAKMAEQLAGLFEWVPDKFDPKTRLPVEQLSDMNGVITYENDFITWLKKVPTAQLQSGFTMNCWQAVFVTAYQAGLIGHDRLRDIHGFGTAGPAASEGEHDLRVQEALGLDNAFKIVKEIDLVPSRGDLIFASDSHHVMICLGSGIVNGVSGTHVMSLWSKPTRQFCMTTAETVEHVFDMTFVPCPF